LETTKEVLDKLQLERNRVGAAHQLTEPSTQPLVVFMTPSLDGMLTLGYFKSYMETVILLGQHGWQTSFQAVKGDPYLAKVRNHLVSKCLTGYPNATILAFLDADLEWDAPSVLRAVQACAKGHPVVAGIYCKKNDTPDFPSSLKADKETGKLLETDGLLQAVMVSTGFLFVRREVYAAQAAKSLRYVDPMGHGVISWNIYKMGLNAEPQPDGTDGQYWGEDCAWSRETIEMGYDLLVDPEVIFGHTGQKTWRYKFGDFVQGYKDGKAKVIDRSVPGDDTKVVGVEIAAD